MVDIGWVGTPGGRGISMVIGIMAAAQPLIPPATMKRIPMTVSIVLRSRNP
jgi:hypothetical protein